MKIHSVIDATIYYYYVKDKETRFNIFKMCVCSCNAAYLRCDSHLQVFKNCIGSHSSAWLEKYTYFIAS